MISDRIRALRGAHWLALFGLILGCWAAVFAMAAAQRADGFSDIYGAQFWADLCRVTADGAGWPGLVAMWVLMSGAMMAPTALPAFATYDDLTRAGASRAGFARLVAGYLGVWIGFALIAASAQMALTRASLVAPDGGSLSRGFSAALLLGAGLYQFSALKDACLSQCRQPLTFFMQHWSEGPLRNGLRLGAVCLGCCWALMALAFVGGTMSLTFMALATVLMTLEKLPELGRHLTRPLGFALIGSAGLVLIL